MVKYQGAGIGIDRMNQIMQLLLFHSMTIDQITEQMDLSKRLVQNYLAKLLDMGKITVKRQQNGKQGGPPKYYSLAFGAIPLARVEPKNPPTRPRKEVKQKTGPKPNPLARKPAPAEQRSIKTVPAQQIGMRRDPYTAALFGTTQRIST